MWRIRITLFNTAEVSFPSTNVLLACTKLGLHLKISVFTLKFLIMSIQSVSKRVLYLGSLWRSTGPSHASNSGVKASQKINPGDICALQSIVLTVTRFNVIFEQAKKGKMSSWVVPESRQNPSLAYKYYWLSNLRQSSRF